ncbi:MAG: hypothetical protein LBV55_03600 [Acholeplasmatales bacterium]|jgi:DNA polymerase-3 subunit delta'|nr:hypothetical protein [Acholeplasmatales bacterium]
MSKLDLILNSKKNNRLSHLYLINGFSDSNRLDFALSAACIILDIPDSDQNRQRILEGKNENVFLCNYLESFLVSQMESLEREFSKTSMFNKARIFIIEAIDTISDTVANKLLKFLEEPTSTSTFGLILTANKDAVLPTIISRSQTINLDDFAMPEFSLYLINEQKFPPLKAKIASVNKRSLTEANNLINSPAYLAIEEAFLHFIKALTNKEDLLTSLVACDITRFKDNALYLLDLFLIFYIDLLYYKSGVDLYFTEFIHEIMLISSYYTLQQINEFIKLINEKKKILVFYVNLDLQFNDLLIELGRIAIDDGGHKWL